MGLNLLCPACGHLGEPVLQIRQMAIDRYCGASLVIDDAGRARRATANDIASLDLQEIQQLVEARAKIARPNR